MHLEVMRAVATEREKRCVYDIVNTRNKEMSVLRHSPKPITPPTPFNSESPAVPHTPFPLMPDSANKPLDTMALKRWHNVTRQRNGTPSLPLPYSPACPSGGGSLSSSFELRN